MADSIPLVLGAGGQVGTAFVSFFEHCHPATRTDLDLARAQPDDIRRLLSDANPSAVINCAAYTAVDRAEDEEELATRINGRAVGWLAQGAAELGIPLLTYSTDYVFDGAGTSPYLESHLCNPINAYGRSKRVGEEEALAAGGRVLVIRTSWVLSSSHRNFVTAILSRARDGHPLKVVDDQEGCPTYATDLAVASWKAMELGADGLLHLTNRGETTWYRIAIEAVERAGMDTTLVSPCSTGEYPTPAKRPAYSVLGSEVVGPLGLDPLPEWRDSFAPVIAGGLRLIEG